VSRTRALVFGIALVFALVSAQIIRIAAGDRALVNYHAMRR